MSQVILLCGYKRTGKDRLFTILSSTNTGFKWHIYKHSSNMSIFPSKDTSYRRTAFADALKQEVYEEYDISPDVPDTEKEIKQFIHHKTGTLISSRDANIEWASIRRHQDPDNWCKKAFLFFNREIWIVSDWSFPNEEIYVKTTFSNVLTIRLYRSDVPEPDINIESEHALDQHLTDFLLIPEYEEFNIAIQRFPQYIDYVLCGCI